MFFKAKVAIGKVKTRSIKQIKKENLFDRENERNPAAVTTIFLTHGVVSALELGPGQPPINVNKRFDVVTSTVK
jgi:hypothetical protein